MKPTHLFIGLMVSLFWGANIAVSKLAAGYMPPFALSALRLAIVAVCILPFTRQIQTPLLKTALIAQIWGTVYFMFFFMGLYLGADAAVAAVLMQLALPFSTFLGMTFLNERVGTQKIVGIIVALLGVYILKEAPNVLAYPIGALCVIGTAITWAIVNTIIKSNNEPNFMALTGWMALFSSMSLAMLSIASDFIPILPNEMEILAKGVNWNSEFVASLLFMSLVATIAVSNMWLYLLKYNPAHIVSALLIPVPIFGVITAALLFQEQISGSVWTGGTIIILGLTLILLRRRKRKAGAEIYPE